MVEGEERPGRVEEELPAIPRALSVHHAGCALAAERLGRLFCGTKDVEGLILEISGLGLSLPEEEPGALYFVSKKWAFVSPAFSARLVVIQS